MDGAPAPTARARPTPAPKSSAGLAVGLVLAAVVLLAAVFAARRFLVRHPGGGGSGRSGPNGGGAETPVVVAAGGPCGPSLDPPAQCPPGTSCSPPGGQGPPACLYPPGTAVDCKDSPKNGLSCGSLGLSLRVLGAIPAGTLSPAARDALVAALNDYYRACYPSARPGMASPTTCPSAGSRLWAQIRGFATNPAAEAAIKKAVCAVLSLKFPNLCK